MTRGEIAVRLSRARLQAGLTQAELAEAMGTPQPAIARAESGYRMPSIEFIDRWAKATGKPITLTLGESSTGVPNRAERRRIVESVLGPGRFNPWDRQLTRVEAAQLERAGMDRAYFERLRSSSGRPRGRSKAR